MKILLNNTITPLPSDFMTVAELIDWKGIRPAGTAIAINDKVISKNLWNSTTFNDMDRVTVISAAFGG